MVVAGRSCSGTRTTLAFTVVVAPIIFASVVVEQTHIALTRNRGEMLATWVVLGAPASIGDLDAQVLYGEDDLNLTSSSALAVDHSYTDGGFNGTIFEATMTGLKDGCKYFYQTTAHGASSPTFHFTYKVDHESIRFLSYGDMGIKNSHGTYRMTNEDARSGDYDLLINVGDTSYADDYKKDHNAFAFDAHFRNIEPHASAMPFMAVPGNHEKQYNFAGYLNRLRMPAPPRTANTTALSRFYYSFDYGPAHFVSYSSEHTFVPGSEQWQFLSSDLMAASLPAARLRRPWIIVWSHRPLYCSDSLTWATRCTKEAELYRANIEDLLVAAKVDLHISGHNHQYERSFPVAGCKGAYTSGCNVSQNLHNAPWPVFIVNGAGGNIEGIEPTWMPDKRVPFRAVHDQGLHTGYARVSVNRTSLDWTFLYSGAGVVPGLNVSSDKDAGKVIDHFMLTKG